MDSPKSLVLIAGAGPGMGFALARQFAAEGHRVVTLARNIERLAAFTETLRSEGWQADHLAADLTRVEELESVFAECVGRFGAPGIVIYNAGRWEERPLLDWSHADFMAELNLCVGTAHRLAQLAVPPMVEAGGGQLIFTGGGLALFPQYGVSVGALSAGKAALRNYVYALAPQLKPKGVRVGTITIAGQVVEGTAFAPALIAESFWAWSKNPEADTEVVFRG